MKRKEIEHFDRVVAVWRIVGLDGRTKDEINMSGTFVRNIPRVQRSWDITTR